MFPSKAERILSRYRPIAPKPLPIPPSGSWATDPSSTCASLDSFTSSSKVRRTRKRRIAPSASGKLCKTPKLDHSQIVSALSNNNAGVSSSSLTQGTDATVPRADSSNLSHSFGMRRPVSTSLHMAMDSTSLHMVMDVPERPCMPLGDPSVLSTPFSHHSAANLVEQARMFMVADVAKARQQPSLLLSPRPRSIPSHGEHGIIDKNLAFMMERADTSTVLPDRGSSAGLSCSAGCMKGVNYSGGGFTEMIRGITRLPTAADVQSLMQARSSTVAMEPPPSVENIVSCGQTSPVPAEVHHRQLKLQSSCWAPDLRLPQADDCTLPLLPNVPSKASFSTDDLQSASSLCGSSHILEPLLDHAKDLHGNAIMDNSPDNVLSLSAPGSRDARVQLDTLRQASNEADGADAHPLSCCSLESKLLGGLASSSVLPSPNSNGTTVDQVYLEQVYGGSTDPVLLVDDNRQALWFNKAYDRALKSASERRSNKTATTGPYIDPLGHPTPLGSLVFNQDCGTSKLVNCILWGFLRKLVMPEVVFSSHTMRESKMDFSRMDLQYENQSPSKLCLSVGERGSQSIPHACSSSMPACRIDGTSEVQGYGNAGKLTTVTLESITDVHMGEGEVSMESVESAEVRLGAARNVPAFITDCTTRVRWVNTAFKQMLGSSEQQGNDPGMMMGSNGAGLVRPEPLELTFVCSAEKIPRSAWAFSGLVNLEWMKVGKRRSMTVPCDVSRLVPAATWVWKFDLALSLSLNLCV